MFNFLIMEIFLIFNMELSEKTVSAVRPSVANETHTYVSGQKKKALYLMYLKRMPVPLHPSNLIVPT